MKSLEHILRVIRSNQQEMPVLSVIVQTVASAAGVTGLIGGLDRMLLWSGHGRPVDPRTAGRTWSTRRTSGTRRPGLGLR